MATEPAPTPVIVELFTSEGCSSCPPADRSLAALDGAGTVPGAEVIVLGFHVDYWNRLGWADPYSSSEASARQREHAAQLGRDSVFTPQALVNGRDSMVGSEENAVRAALGRGARGRTLRLPLTATVQRDTVQVRSSAAAQLPEGTEAVIALTEAHLSTQVTSGENAGETLAHAPAVRWFRKLGAWKGSVSVDIPLSRRWKRGQLRAVVWLTAPDSGAVLAAGTVRP